KKGKEHDSNWAAKIQKGIKFAKKVTSIPYIDKVPGLGWLTRRVKGWQLDIADWVAGQFAEEGTADVEDTTRKEDTTLKDQTDTSKQDDIKATDKTETKRTLTEDYKSKTDTDWKEHLKDVTETQKHYKSLTKKDSTSADDKTHSEDYSRKVD